MASSDVAYSRENDVISRFRTIADRTDSTPEETAQALKDFCTHYERLLEDSKLLTSVGDRLQRKLKHANVLLRDQSDEMKRLNESLESKNAELQFTIDELTKAKLSRRAATLTLFVTFTVFLVSELLEELIDSVTAGNDWANIFSWGFKGGLVFLFQPIQTALERRLLAQERKRVEKERRLQAATRAADDSQNPPTSPQPRIKTRTAAPTPVMAGGEPPATT